MVNLRYDAPPSRSSVFISRDSARERCYVLDRGKETRTVNGSTRSFSNRRKLLKGGAALSGAAMVAAGMTTHPALAQEASPSRLQQVLDRGKLVVGTGSTNPPWHYE